MALAKSLSLYVNGIDLGTSIKSFSTEASAEEQDTTTIGVTGNGRTYITTFQNGTLSAEGIWNYDQTNADEIHNLFSAAMANRTESVVTASLALLAVGGAALILNAVSTKYDIDTSTGVLIMAMADFRATTGINFGKWHFTAEVDTTTTNGTGVDNSAATSNGGIFHVHYQNGGGTEDLTAKIQHSTDNSTWADLGTITVNNINGFGASSLEIAAGTTVNRYTRAQIAVASGALNVQAAFARR